MRNGRADRRTDMTKQIVAFRKILRARLKRIYTPQPKQIGFYRTVNSMHSTNSGQIFANAVVPHPGPILLHGWKVQSAELKSGRYGPYFNPLAPELFFFIFQHTLYIKCE